MIYDVLSLFRLFKHDRDQYGRVYCLWCRYHNVLFPITNGLSLRFGSHGVRKEMAKQMVCCCQISIHCWTKYQYHWAFNLDEGAGYFGRIQGRMANQFFRWGSSKTGNRFFLHLFYLFQFFSFVSLFFFFCLNVIFVCSSDSMLFRCCFFSLLKNWIVSFC